MNFGIKWECDLEKTNTSNFSIQKQGAPCGRTLKNPHTIAICTTGRSPLAARAVPAFYLHFIYCGMQFAVVANELNMRIAIIPKENEKSEPFSNRKQVRIFLVWWARVDSNHRS